MNIQTFAGFTQVEWAAGLSRVMDSQLAAREAEDLFRVIAESGSNGYALPADQWALLASLGEDAESRVRERIADYPSAFRDEVAQALASIRRTA